MPLQKTLIGMLLFLTLGISVADAQTTGIWTPALNTSWQWQLTTPVDQNVDVQLYDIDMFDNEASVVASLHAKGRKVLCYIDVGTWENWRPDANRFPNSVLGNGNGWAGERWLNIRRLDILGPIMEARLDLCKAKGFDGVEPDNMDGYSNNTGFSLTYQDQITYNIFIANAAHARGLSVGLKNDVEQVLDLLPYFDWTINEQCFQYKECNSLLPFLGSGKAVFQVEYKLSTSKFCPKANTLGFNSMKKHLSLDAYRVPCDLSATTDTIPPTVSVTVPPNGATVSGLITVSATASDNVGVVGVQLKLDGNNFGSQSLTSTVSVSWNTAATANGAHTLTAVARDAVGNTATSASVTVTVANLTDATPPAAISTLSTTGSTSNSVPLTWVAPGDDGNVGTAASYDIRYSTSVISDAMWAASTQAIGEPAPMPAGTAQTYTVTSLSPGLTYYFAIKTIDDASNWSGLSNVENKATTTSTTTTSVWKPALNTSWQWQLTTPVNQSVNVQMYDIDLFDNDASVVASLHTQDRKVVCYISAGTWENWRPDANQFPSSVLGNGNGWPGERWLDIRRLDILGPIIEKRLDLCKAKGFDGVEPDNVDGYSNNSGFPLSYQDQLNYNRFIANAAHTRGLSVGLKNDVEQVQDLQPYFDWTLNEQCFQYQECNTLSPFINAGKAVFQVEYKLDTSQFCPSANAMNFNSMKKNMDLDAWRVPCR